jgi:hypothetical protein
VRVFLSRKINIFVPLESRRETRHYGFFSLRTVFKGFLLKANRKTFLHPISGIITKIGLIYSLFAASQLLWYALAENSSLKGELPYLLLRKTPLSKVSYRYRYCDMLLRKTSLSKVSYRYYDMLLRKTSLSKVSYRYCDMLLPKAPLSKRWFIGTVTLICSCGKLLSQKCVLSVPLLWYALAENSSLKKVIYRYRYCDMLLRRCGKLLSQKGDLSVPLLWYALAENSSLKNVFYRYRYCDMLLRKTPLSKRWFIGTVTVICSCGKLLSQKGELPVPLLCYAVVENSSLKGELLYLSYLVCSCGKLLSQRWVTVSVISSCGKLLSQRWVTGTRYRICDMLLRKTPLSKVSYRICDMLLRRTPLSKVSYRTIYWIFRSLDHCCDWLTLVLMISEKVTFNDNNN